MSRNTGNFSYYQYQPPRPDENVENSIPAAVRAKDLSSRTVLAANRRAVLGTVTNMPLVGVPSQGKQTDGEGRKRDSFVQTNLVGKPVLPRHSQMPTVQSVTRRTVSEAPAPPLQPMVDLSCHEMDVSLETSRRPTYHNLPPSDDCDEMFDEEDSPVLLDMSSSEDEMTDESENAEETAQQERMDRLMSMEEYREEIYEYMRKAELVRRPRPNYMHRQTDITSNMRTILVDWLVEVADEYKLHRETLFLAVDYVDRFLSVMAVQRSKLQLVGAAAMFIASKYEEIYPPDVGEFVYITDDTYTKQQVLRMEHLLLKVLSFDVAMPTVHTFCNRFLKDLRANDKTCSLAMYLIELSLLDGDVFLQYIPSITAAAAICLANITFGASDPWPPTAVELTGYKVADFQACMNDLLPMYQKAAFMAQQAVCEKYKQTKYHEVSLIEPPKSLPLFRR